MKQYKKPVSLVAALALMAALLAGCGNSNTPSDNTGDGETLTPEQVIAKVQENTAKAKSLSYTMTMDMGMSISANGESMDMDMTTTMTADMIADPLQMQINTSVDMGELGGVTEMLMYGEAANGATTLYVSTDNGATWASQEVTNDDLAQYDAAQGLELYTDILKDIKEGSSETINGVTATKYTGTIPSTDMADVIRASGAADSFASLGLNASDLDAMVADLGDMTFSMWVDKEKLLPVRYEFDMSDIMSKLTSNLLSAMGEQVAGLEMSITKTVAEMDITAVDTVTSIERPANLDAAA